MYGLAQSSRDVQTQIKLFKDVVRVSADHYRALTQLGVIYMNLQEPDLQRALKYLGQAIKINPNYAASNLYYAQIMFDTGDLNQATQHFNIALKSKELTQSLKLKTLVGLGNSLFEQQVLEGALAAYSEACEMNPELHDVHFRMGNAYYQLDQTEQSLKAYEKSLKLKADLPEVWYNFGNALCVMALYEQAITSFNKALELDPSNSAAFYNLGNALYMLNRF